MNINPIKIISNRYKKYKFLNKIKMVPLSINTELKTKPKGTVLFSYLAYPLAYEENDERFNGHSNSWESREIVRIFNRLGYEVDAIDCNNSDFHPQKKYDIIFDIYTNLQRLTPFLDEKTLKLWHPTIAYYPYTTKAELSRVDALEKRRSMFYTPKKLAGHVELAERSLRFANACCLIGNEYTLSTFPQKYQSKITPITVSSSILNYIKKSDEYIPKKREFLWFAGTGAVRKGLDLAIEVFAKNPKLTLNIIGGTSQSKRIEEDFFKIYEYELTQLPNIKYHGYLSPTSEKFKEIMENTFCFVSPSSTEGLTPSGTTCMQIGLYPIVSLDCGITLPDKCGMYLKKCSIQEIEEAVYKAYNSSDEELMRQISTCQKMAQQRYTRSQFTKEMTSFLTKTIAEHNVK
jgi:glycosyltransferase involved in cell wall biosynthesis